MSQFLSHLAQVLSSPAPSAESLAQLILLQPAAHQAIQQSLRSSSPSSWSEEAISQVITRSQRGFDPSVASRLATVFHHLLRYIQQHPPIASLTQSSAMSSTQWSTQCSLQQWQSAHAAWAIVFTRSSGFFVQQGSPIWFQDAFRAISRAFVTLSIRVDVLNSQKGKMPLLSEATAKLAGPVRAAGTDRTPGTGEDSKRKAVIWLGNECLRGYFKLNNLKLCETVLKSISEALSRNKTSATWPGANGEEIYNLSDRITYRFYLGRVRLSQGRVRSAFTHFQWALEHCHTHAQAQTRRILLHLIPAAIVLGLRPSAQLQQLLHSTFLDDVRSLYEPLWRAYSRSDLHQWEVLMSDRYRKETLRRLGVYLLLREKAPIGMWRGVIKRTLLLSPPPASSKPSAPPTLPLSQLSKALSFLLPSGSQPSTLDLECIIASLVDQGYIKGYTFHSKQIVVFQKGENKGFGRVADVY